MHSMTGFASGTGASDVFAWTWDLRSVNGKGLDLRIRVPDWVEGLEAALKTRLAKSCARGNVTLSLRLARDETAANLELNQAQLSAILSAMSEVEQQAMDLGLSLSPSTAADIVSLRGVLDQPQAQDDTTGLRSALLADFEAVVTAFATSRAQEGAAIKTTLDGQLGQIDRLIATCAALATARQDTAAETLRTNVEKLLDATDKVDADRLAQELALIAVKTDVTEEIDRLGAHVQAARALLDSQEPIGRRFDFLMQEFNREANTLCSKAQSKELTAAGLDLKVLIDQMREQVQNIE